MPQESQHFDARFPFAVLPASVDELPVQPQAGQTLQELSFTSFLHYLWISGHLWPLTSRHCKSKAIASSRATLGGPKLTHPTTIWLHSQKVESRAAARMLTASCHCPRKPYSVIACVGCLLHLFWPFDVRASKNELVHPFGWTCPPFGDPACMLSRWNLLNEKDSKRRNLTWQFYQQRQQQESTRVKKQTPDSVLPVAQPNTLPVPHQQPMSLCCPGNGWPTLFCQVLSSGPTLSLSSVPMQWPNLVFVQCPAFLNPTKKCLPVPVAGDRHFAQITGEESKIESKLKVSSARIWLALLCGH